MAYDPYGRARHQRRGDVNGGEGSTSISDSTAVVTRLNNNGGPTNIVRDNTVSIADINKVSSDFGSATSVGRVTYPGSVGTDNIIGFSGYVFNPVTCLTFLYHSE